MQKYALNRKWFYLYGKSAVDSVSNTDSGAHTDRRAHTNVLQCIPYLGNLQERRYSSLTCTYALSYAEGLVQLQSKLGICTVS